MKPMTLHSSRDEDLVVSRVYQNDDGTPINISGWTGAFELNFIPQLHGEGGSAVLVTDGLIISPLDGSVIAVVEVETIRTLEHSVYLWSFWIAPPTGSPVMLGWGLVELSP